MKKASKNELGTPSSNAVVHLQSSMELPPFWHCLLYKRIPVTSMARSFSCCSLSFLLSEMKVIISVWGNILCKAAINITMWEKTLNVREQKRKSLNKKKIASPKQMQKVGNTWEIYTSRLSSDSLDSKHSSQRYPICI